MRVLTFWVLAAASILDCRAVFAVPFEFDGGTTQGWTAELHAFDSDSRTSLTLQPPDGAIWWDYTNYPGMYGSDPSGDSNGSIVRFVGGDLGDLSSYEYLFITYRSPDLSGMADWQGIDDFSGQINFAGQGVLNGPSSADVFLDVFDQNAGSARRFAASNPTTLTQGVWNERAFDSISATLAGASPAVTNYTLTHVGFNVWIPLHPLPTELVGMYVDHVVPGASAGNALTWTGATGVNRWQSAGNWAPSGLGPPGDVDTATIGNGDLVFLDGNFGSGDRLDALTISGGSGLVTNGYEALIDDSVNGSTALTWILGADSRIVVEEHNSGPSHDSFDTDALAVGNGGLILMSGGRLEVDSGTFSVSSNSRVIGHGFIDLEASVDAPDDIFINNGILWAEAPSGLYSDSLILHVADSDGRISLDGTTGTGEVRVGERMTLILDGQLFRAFNSSLTMERSSVLEVTKPWTNGSEGVVNINADPFGVDPERMATIRGAPFTNHGTINVNSGELVIEAEYVDSGNTIHVSGTRLRLDAAATIANPDFSGAFELTVGPNGDAVINAGALDWDGNGSAQTTVEAGGSLTINADSVDLGGNQQFDGTLVNRGLVTVNLPTAWTMEGQLTLAEGVVGGSALMRVGGTLSAQDAVISAPVMFRPTAEVAIGIGHEGYQLELDGHTTYLGGTYRGGMIQQDGVVDVLGSTTLGTNDFKVVIPNGAPPYQRNWIQVFDWDGSAGSAAETTIWPGVTFTINATAIDDNPSTNGYDGTVHVNGGTLLVNTGVRVEAPPPNLPVGAVYPAIVSPLPWRLDGTLNLQESGGNAAVVASAYASPLLLYGEVNALRGNASIGGMAVTLTPSGQIHVAGGANLSMNVSGGGSIDVDAGGLFRLNGSSTLNSLVQVSVDGTAELDAHVVVEGGTYTGEGTLRMLGATDFDETTRLDVYSEFISGGTNAIAAGKELQLGESAGVEHDAVFRGDGTLRNLVGSELSLIGSAANFGVELINEGTFSPRSSSASTGTARIAEFTQLASGHFKMEIAGTAIDQYDRVVFTSPPQLGGLLDIFLGSFTPSPSDAFRFLFADSFSGNFSNVGSDSRVETSDGAGSFLFSCSGTSSGMSCTLSDFESLALPGDFNHDGRRDGKDFLTWQRGESPLPYDVQDLQVWQANYGIASSLASPQNVPEPATTLTATLAILAILLCPRSNLWASGDFASWIIR